MNHKTKEQVRLNEPGETQEDGITYQKHTDRNRKMKKKEGEERLEESILGKEE